MSNDKFVLQFTHEEALVLFDWISRLNELEDSSTIQDQAEKRILWDIESMLERSLPEVLDPDYESQLAAAREKVRDLEA
ncbi:hypothetical protein [Marininema halotolerans]|uniref:Uncharacterized protein n=1 Tax=Marininema halotolerans TaxID=1155944 RepID=A0A1I6PZZ5_9BACL|nr:hypothetical protein [Marininema halotolerans]SFS45809.1 hypothetical protein SAMN05444972_102251 [Marininema halotolerans]